MEGREKLSQQIAAWYFFAVESRAIFHAGGEWLFLYSGNFERQSMKFMKYLLPSCILLLSAGCAVEKQLVPSGGSRSDGVVNLSFDHGALVSPKVDTQLSLSTATKTCVAWGYTSAQRFGEPTQRCVRFFDDGGCITYRVTVQYQCTVTR